MGLTTFCLYGRFFGPRPVISTGNPEEPMREQEVSATSSRDERMQRANSLDDGKLFQSILVDG